MLWRNNLSYISSGRDVDGTIVVFHGVTDSAASLHDVARHFNSNWRVILVDSLGHGLSPRLDVAALSFDTFEAQFRAALTLVGEIAAQTPGRQVVLYGHSMGGALAANIAARFPKLVRALVLEDPALLTQQQAEQYLAGGAALVKARRDVVMDVTGALETIEMNYPFWPKVEYLGWAQGKLEVDPEYLLTGVVGTTGRELLAQLEVPTLLVTGDGDDVLFGQNGLDEAQQLGNSLLEVSFVEGASHTVRRDESQAFYAVMDDFLQRFGTGELTGTVGVDAGSANDTSRVPQVGAYLNPELLELLKAAPLHETYSVGEMRSKAAEKLDGEVPVEDGLTREVRHFDGVECRVIVPAQPKRLIFSIHGGGYVAGSARYDDPRNMKLAQELDAVVVAPEYRLAPEYPFPAGRDDCANALLALRQPDFEFNELPMFIYADSAGAGLAEQVLFTGIQEQLGLSGLISLEPCLAPQLATPSVKQYAQGPVWPLVAARTGWDAYLSYNPFRGRHEVLPETVFSPEQRDARCYPPTLVFVNPADTLRDEALQWALNLMDAGVQVRLHMYPGTFHGHLSAAGTKVWQQTLADIRAFVESC